MKIGKLLSESLFTIAMLSIIVYVLVSLDILRMSFIKNQELSPIVYAASFYVFSIIILETAKKIGKKRGAYILLGGLVFFIILFLEAILLDISELLSLAEGGLSLFAGITIYVFLCLGIIKIYRTLGLLWTVGIVSFIFIGLKSLSAIAPNYEYLLAFMIKEFSEMWSFVVMLMIVYGFHRYFVKTRWKEKKSHFTLASFSALLLFFIICLTSPTTVTTQIEELLRCGDGTPHGSCSINKPYYCSFRQLMENPSVCGCSNGQIFLDGSCINLNNLPYEKRKLSYCIHGTKGYIAFKVYPKLNSYFSDLSKRLSCE